MKLADILALISDESKHDTVAEAWNNLAAKSKQAGIAEANVDARRAEKALREAEAERDQIKEERDTLAATVGSAAGLSDRLKAAEKALRDVEAERDRMRPVVERHQRDTLRSLVAEAAGLRDPYYAAAIVADLGIVLGDDGKLGAEHAEALKAWAADPANKDRVKPAESATSQQQQTQPHQVRAPAVAGATEGRKIQEDLARLERQHGPAAAAAARARLQAEGLL